MSRKKQRTAMAMLICGSCTIIGLNIAKFIFLIKFTIDVAAVDIECDR